METQQYLTVENLIEQLKKFDPKAKVSICIETNYDIGSLEREENLEIIVYDDVVEITSKL